MNIKGTAKKCQFKFQQNKGLIFTLVSAGCEIAAVALMAKQAPKAEKILIPANKKLEMLKSEMNNTEMVAKGEVIPAEHKKEMRRIQRKTFAELAKVYSLPIIFTGASLTFMGGSYKVMKDKQIAIGAAYATIDNAFKSYRRRVKEKYGDDVENALFRDIKETKKTKEEINPVTGDLEKTDEIIKKANAGGGYEIMFDASSILWSKSGRTNYETLMQLQKQANISLKVNGYLFLSDVIDMLELPKTTINPDLLAASKVVGWIYDPYDTSLQSWISFGISDENGHPNEIGNELFNNEERDVLLSFNVDGNILNGTNGKSFTKYVKD